MDTQVLKTVKVKITKELSTRDAVVETSDKIYKKEITTVEFELNGKKQQIDYDSSFAGRKKIIVKDNKGFATLQLVLNNGKYKDVKLLTKDAVDTLIEFAFPDEADSDESDM